MDVSCHRCDLDQTAFFDVALLKGRALHPEEACLEVQTEHTLEVLVGEEVALRLVCTPDHVAELALGRLLTEGTIEGPGDVASLCVCDGGARVRVELRAGLDTSVPNGCAPAVCTTVNAPARAAGAELRPVEPIAWDPVQISALARAFHGLDTPMHARTHGAHSATLALSDGVPLSCEDIGRHNALDKVVGMALLAGVDLRRATLVTSGRVPVDMAAKAIRARVPVLVTAAVPTEQAVELAIAHRLTLLGFARDGSLAVYNDAWGGTRARRCGAPLAQAV